MMGPVDRRLLSLMLAGHSQSMPCWKDILSSNIIQDITQTLNANSTHEPPDTLAGFAPQAYRRPTGLDNDHQFAVFYGCLGNYWGC